MYRRLVIGLITFLQAGGRVWEARCRWKAAASRSLGKRSRQAYALSWHTFLITFQTVWLLWAARASRKCQVISSARLRLTYCSNKSFCTGMVVMGVMINCTAFQMNKAPNYRFASTYSLIGSLCAESEALCLTWIELKDLLQKHLSTYEEALDKAFLTADIDNAASELNRDSLISPKAISLIRLLLAYKASFRHPYPERNNYTVHSIVTFKQFCWPYPLNTSGSIPWH